jgi:hypothetical protein
MFACLVAGNWMSSISGMVLNSATLNNINRSPQ